MKSLIGGIVLTTLMTPALAADQYWVEYDYSTHGCSIVVKQVDDTAADATNDTAVADTPQDGTAKGMPTPAPIVVQRFPETAPDTAKDSAAADAPQGGPNAMPTPSPIVVEGSSQTAPNTAKDSAAAATSKNATNADGTYDAEKGPVAAAWAQKKAAAEAAGTTNITTALIGDPMRSREEAEYEMQIMRKCGIRN